MLPINHLLFTLLIFKNFKNKRFLIFLLLVSLLPDIYIILGIEHRTLTHSVFIPTTLLLLAIFNKNFLFIAIFLFSHLALDLITGEVQIFYPFEFLDRNKHFL